MDARRLINIDESKIIKKSDELQSENANENIEIDCSAVSEESVQETIREPIQKVIQNTQSDVNSIKEITEPVQESIKESLPQRQIFKAEIGFRCKYKIANTRTVVQAQSLVPPKKNIKKEEKSKPVFIYAKDKINNKIVTTATEAKTNGFSSLSKTLLRNVLIKTKQSIDETKLDMSVLNSLIISNSNNEEINYYKNKMSQLNMELKFLENKKILLEEYLR